MLEDLEDGVEEVSYQRVMFSQPHIVSPKDMLELVSLWELGTFIGKVKDKKYLYDQLKDMKDMTAMDGMTLLFWNCQLQSVSSRRCDQCVCQ